MNKLMQILALQMSLASLVFAQAQSNAIYDAGRVYADEIIASQGNYFLPRTSIVNRDGSARRHFLNYETEIFGQKSNQTQLYVRVAFTSQNVPFQKRMEELRNSFIDCTNLKIHHLNPSGQVELLRLENSLFPTKKSEILEIYKAFGKSIPVVTTINRQIRIYIPKKYDRRAQDKFYTFSEAEYFFRTSRYYTQFMFACLAH